VIASFDAPLLPLPDPHAVSAVAAVSTTAPTMAARPRQFDVNIFVLSSVLGGKFRIDLCDVI
jgi:hypothetical protein